MKKKECLMISKITSEIVYYFLHHHEKVLDISIRYENNETIINVKTPKLATTTLKELESNLKQKRNDYLEVYGGSLVGEGDDYLNLVGSMIDDAKIEIIDDFIIMSLIRKNNE